MRRLDPWLVIGLVLCAALFLLALYGDRLAPNEPTFMLAQGPNGEERPLAPGAPFLLGSDNAGRDLWSLLLWGARTTLALALATGSARLAAGLLLALAGARFRWLRPPVDAAAEILGSLPATLAALLVIAAFFPIDTPVQVFAAALVFVGWPGAYRVLRTELGRLRVAPFTEGARVVGASWGRVLLRHHVPHLVPLLALAGAQQVAATLVAVAELAVLGAFIGVARSIDLSESLRVVRLTDVASIYPVPDVPEWGALLAAARGAGNSSQAIRNLYLGRWIFLVPAAAIAIAAMSVALLGAGIARQYARRDIVHDLTVRRFGATVLAVALVAAPAFLLPPRDASELALAQRVRGLVTAEATGPDDLSAIARDEAFTVEESTNTTTLVEQTAAGRVVVVGADAGPELTQGWDSGSDFAPVLYAESGGGTVDAPVVFAGLGISWADHPVPPGDNPFAAPSFESRANGHVADDYAGIDVRGKAVLFVRPGYFISGRSLITAPDLAGQIRSALSRGAAAVLIADGRKGMYSGATSSSGGAVANPYLALARDAPIRSPSGVPVLVIEPRVADILLAGSGVTFVQVLPQLYLADLASGLYERSFSRAVGTTVHIELPLERRTHVARTIIARNAAPIGDGALVIWAVSPSSTNFDPGAGRALAALARAADAYRDVPVILVLFDPQGDPAAAGSLLRQRLRDARVHALVAIDALRGSRMRFMTRYGVLQPSIDRYADRLGIARVGSASGAEPDGVGFLTAFPETAYIYARGDGRAGDRTADGAALLGYVVARFVARSPELLQ